MKYINLALNLLVAFGLFIISYTFYSKNSIPLSLVFGVLGFMKLQLANIEWRLDI